MKKSVGLKLRHLNPKNQEQIQSMSPFRTEKWFSLKLGHLDQITQERIRAIGNFRFDNGNLLNIISCDNAKFGTSPEIIVSQDLHNSCFSETAIDVARACVEIGEKCVKILHVAESCEPKPSIDNFTKAVTHLIKWIFRHNKISYVAIDFGSIDNNHFMLVCDYIDDSVYYSFYPIMYLLGKVNIQPGDDYTVDAQCAKNECHINLLDIEMAARVFDDPEGEIAKLLREIFTIANDASTLMFDELNKVSSINQSKARVSNAAQTPTDKSISKLAEIHEILNGLTDFCYDMNTNQCPLIPFVWCQLQKCGNQLADAHYQIFKMTGFKVLITMDSGTDKKFYRSVNSMLRQINAVIATNPQGMPDLNEDQTLLENISDIANIVDKHYTEVLNYVFKHARKEKR